MNFTKHKFNIYPEMDSDEYQSLKDDIQKNGYREDLPIIIYNGGIIDGWNRYRACKELGVTPKVKMFRGNDQEAIQYIMSSNKRRNLTSSQRAAIAVEAEDIIKAIEEQVEAERVAKIVENYKERRRKILDKDPDRYNTRMPVAQNAKGETRELIPPSENRNEAKKESAKARTKIAEAFGTNPRYISDAKRLKKENPEAFEKIKKGETTITRVKREDKEILQRAKELKEERKQAYKDKMQQRIEQKAQKPMTEEEAQIMAELKAGNTVVININKHFSVLKYAKDNELYQQIDRYSEWGNPFFLDSDGDRDHVCDAYARYYQDKKSLHAKIKNLKGKALGCHCHPLRCHGHELKKIADNEKN